MLLNSSEWSCKFGMIFCTSLFFLCNNFSLVSVSNFCNILKLTEHYLVATTGHKYPVLYKVLEKSIFTKKCKKFSVTNTFHLLKQCAARNCKTALKDSSYRIDMVGKWLFDKTDKEWVEDVFSFYLKLECLMNPKRGSNRQMLLLDENFLIIEDPTTIITAAEQNQLLTPFKLVCVKEELIH